MTISILYQNGQADEATIEALIAAHRNESFAWLHIHGRSEDARALVGRFAEVPAAAADTLTQQETRPRASVMGNAALINLRGPGEMLAQDSDPLVSIRIWAQHGLVISVGYRELDALADVKEKARRGEIADPGDLIAAIASTITDELDPDVANMGDCIDDIESMLDPENAAEARSRITQTRSRAIAYRRFLAPQRQALERLSLANVGWLGEDDKLHIQEAADRCARMVEELEAIRERAALTHEALTDLRAEQMNQRALMLSIVALVFLPLTFITGLLGMNVKGIPYSDAPWAFWGVTGLCAAIAIGVTAWFAAAHWLKR